MERLMRYVNSINNTLCIVALALLAVLMFLTATDVTGRFFGYPIRGALQMSEMMQVMIICLAWPFTTATMGHVRVDFFVSHFPLWLQNKIDIITNILTLFVFILIAWQGVILTMSNMEMGDLVAIINIPLFPFQIIVVIGAFVNCFALVVQIINLFLDEAKRRP